METVYTVLTRQQGWKIDQVSLLINGLRELLVTDNQIQRDKILITGQCDEDRIASIIGDHDFTLVTTTDVSQLPFEPPF